MSIEDQIQKRYRYEYKKEIATSSLENGRKFAESLNVTKENRSQAIDECYMHMYRNYSGPTYGLLTPVFLLVLKVVLYWLAEKIIDELLDSKA